MPPRPALARHARVLRRGPDALQVGLVDEGIVLSGLLPAEMDLLERLDGSLDLPALRRRAGGACRLDDLLGALRRHDLLADGAPTRGSARPELRNRSVVVDGPGPVGEAIAACLRELEVGRVEVDQAGAPGAAPGREPRHRAAPRRSPARARPDLVVLVADGSLPFGRGQHWRRSGIAHLGVVVDGPRLQLGPLVVPGSPCLRCLDLARADRDPAWPLVLAQLDPSPSAPAGVDADPALKAVAAGLVGARVAALFTGGGDLRGETVDVELPGPRVTTRVWSRHPRCPCLGSRETMDP